MSTLLRLSETQSGLHSENHTIINQPCFFTMLSRQVKAYPENIAVRDSKTSVDYATFQGLIYRNAQRINQRIEIHEPCIGLFCDPSVEMMTGALGVN